MCGAILIYDQEILAKCSLVVLGNSAFRTTFSAAWQLHRSCSLSILASENCLSHDVIWPSSSTHYLVSLCTLLLVQWTEVEYSSVIVFYYIVLAKDYQSLTTETKWKCMDLKTKLEVMYLCKNGSLLKWEDDVDWLPHHCSVLWRTRAKYGHLLYAIKD